MHEGTKPTSQEQELRERVALVTGAARGIGLHIATRLAESGCTVVLTDVDADGAARGAAAIGGAASALPMDVRDRAAIRDTVQRVLGAHGRIDILVNNAGVLAQGPYDQTDGAAWDELVAVNLTGIYNCVQAVVPSMIDRGRGNIVNLASVSAARGGGSVGNVWYGTTKAGVVAITQGLARELGPRGIRVNAIAPAVVDTDMMKPYLTEAVRGAICARIPLRRLAHKRDLGELAAWLVGDRSEFITGQTIAVDGGLLST
jgi:3-oxoacyl-[acyl-carrier protein] reductase